MKADGVIGQDFQLMQDGAKTHTAKDTLIFLKEKGVKVLSYWPSVSPDLNPIENFWSLTKRGIQKDLQVLSLDSNFDLYEIAARNFHRVCRKCLKSIFHKYKNRLLAIIENNGERLKY